MNIDDSKGRAGGEGADDLSPEAGIEELRAAWSARAASDTRLAERAGGLLAAEHGVFGSVLEAVAARSSGVPDAETVRADEAALAVGRAAHARELDLPALQHLFGHLNDVVTERELLRATDAAGHLCPVRATEAVRRVRDAMERPTLEAMRGWSDEAGRKLRHDVKTPLQATSLNLELLTLESAERGLDTDALDTIQRSLDQVVDLLARAEATGG